MLQCGNHQDPIAPFQALTEKPADILAEQPIVGPVELHQMLFGPDCTEKPGQDDMKFPSAARHNSRHYINFGQS